MTEAAAINGVATNVVQLDPWKAGLLRRTTKSGDSVLVANASNVALILTHNEGFAGCFVRNEFSGTTEIAKPLPHFPGLLPTRLGPMDDYALENTVAALLRVNDLSVPLAVAARGIEMAARQRCYNPVRDYLCGLVWDGVERLDTWLMMYLGAIASEYTASVGRWWMISAVARAMKPGCQADHVLILQGLQGRGKSSALGVLGGEWFVPKIPPIRDYAKAAHAMAGAWIVEMGELGSAQGASNEQLKDFVTLRSDRYQPPYGHYVITQKRTCVFSGSTNNQHPLRDPTGARRFWPVHCALADIAGLTRDRDQLWAEAAHRYAAGERYWPDASHAELFGEEQEARYEADVWEARIGAWLDGPRTLDGGEGMGELDEPKDRVTLAEVMTGALGLTARDWTPEAQRRAWQALHRLGWESRQCREHGARVRRYWRPVADPGVSDAAVREPGEEG